MWNSLLPSTLRVNNKSLNIRYSLPSLVRTDAKDVCSRTAVNTIKHLWSYFVIPEILCGLTYLLTCLLIYSL